MATRTWSGLGTTNNLTEAANWDVVPVAGDDLIFAGSVRLTPNNNFAADTSFASITFAVGASAFILAGNRITLTGNITNSSSNAQTLNIAVIVNVATCNLSASASGSLNMAGVISETGGARVVAAVGAGILTLGAANTFSGGFSLNAGTIQGNASASFGTGTVTCAGGTTITGNLGNNPNFTNAFVLNGQLTVQVPFSSGFDVTFSGVVSGTGSFYVTSDGSGRRFELTAANTFTGGVLFGASGQNGRLRVGTNTSLGTGTLTVDQTGTNGIEAINNGLIIANPVVINSGRTLSLQSNSTNALTLSGVISGLGNVRMSANTGGSCTLSNTNTYTGTTAIASGRLILSGGNNRIVTSSVVTVDTQGIFDISNILQTITTITFTGSARFRADVGVTTGLLTVIGTATISGIAEVGAYPSPVISTAYTILSAAILTGTFQPVSTDLTLGGQTFQISYPTNTVVLTDNGAARTFLMFF